MPANRVDATLANADRDAVMQGIEAISQKLPFLTDLSSDDRHALPKMGDKSRAFVQKAMEVAAQHDTVLPRSFDVQEMRRDVELLLALEPIRVAMNTLNERLNDTLLVIGSEAYVSALTVYRSVQHNGEGGALNSLLDDLGQRFARKSPTPEEPAK